jgi:hypothetical protein
VRRLAIGGPSFFTKGRKMVKMVGSDMKNIQNVQNDEKKLTEVAWTLGRV